VTDPKTLCTCKHPASEHSEIEGLGRGHCKVPGCDCGAFVPAGPTDAAEGVPPRHTLIARATDAEGSKGINLVAAGGPGVAMQVPDAVAMKIGQEAREEYRKIFGEDAVHVGVAGLPFLEDQDKEPGGFNMPYEPGIHMKEGSTLEDAIEAVKESGPILQRVPLASLRPRDRLVVALQPIDIELAARALMDEYGTSKERGSLAMTLTERGTPDAIELSNRIRAGEFEGAG
jgi:hypothetical protein